MSTVEDILVSPPGPEMVVQPAEYFGNAAPVELEIGCGKGGFILERAKRYPERSFLGVEWANKYCRYAADRMVRWGVSNVRLMRTDAGNLVRHHLVPSSLAALHVYHPDPWPKKRHHKRRLFQTEFIAAAVRTLQPGARLAVQTDHGEYFAWIRERLDPVSELVQVDFEHPDFASPGGSPRTNFEVKYVREGRTIYRVAYIRA
ncbi:MAG: tRNA (guanosine(46)-N7)-methyltransferase TrmB [bacterium]|nr:tRNA (guanosine(46)-N7)-methyltransferase TrmB [bacterium]